MVQINDLDTQKFTLNGIEYFKNFTPIVVGNLITIVNTYDSKIVIVPLTIYSYFEVDGNTFANVGLLQSALLPVVFTRGSLGDFLSSDETTYTDATLPLSDTDELLVNQGGTWKKVDKSELGGGGTPAVEKLSDLIDNNSDFSLSDFDVSGSATYSIESGNLKASGSGSFDFESKALHKAVTNVENFTAELDWTLADARTSGTYGLAFSLRSIGQFYEYGYQMLYDASSGNPNSGKLNVYHFTNGGSITNIHLSSVVIPMALNDQMRYTIHRNKNNYTFMIENLTQNKRTSFYFKSSVATGYSGTRIVNNICRFGVAKQTAEDVDFYVQRLNVKRNLNKNLDFLFLGDSITFGYETGADITQRYPDLIFSNTKSLKTFGVYAEPGNTSLDFTYLTDEILELNPSNLVINIGMNDAQNSVSTATFIANINTILTDLTGSGINVIFCLIKPYDTNLATITAYNEAIESNFSGDYLVIDTFRPLIKSSNPALHPTNEEHNHIAQLIEIEIEDLL